MPSLRDNVNISFFSASADTSYVGASLQSAIMDDCLYDTSWKLHTVSQVSPSYAALCASYDPCALKRPAEQLKNYLLSTTEERALHENEQPDVEKTGSLREVTFRAVLQTGILISVTHERALSKFLLYGDVTSRPYRLLLTKAAAPIVHKFTTFLFDTFSVSTIPTKLPGTLLYNTLEYYMITATRTQQSAEATLSALRLSFSFSPPIAPKLRSMDIDIPIGPIASRADPTPHETIMKSISAHLQRVSGILPIAIGLGTETKDGENKAPLAQLSKVSCAGFALSAEGRLKFTHKAVETALDFALPARLANQNMLDAILAEVMKEMDKNG
jgi:hypothetical protein